MNYNYPLTGENTKINIDPVELVDVHNLKSEQIEIGGFSEELLIESINNWRKALRIVTGQDLSLALKLDLTKEQPYQITFNNEGLMNEFASLKTIKDIESFSKKYGLLGIKPPDKNQLENPYSSVRRTIQEAFIFNDYGFSVFEPIELWLWHISEVRKILKLYDVIRNESSENLIKEIIEIRKPIEHKTSGLHFGKAELTEPVYVNWNTGEHILLLPETMKKQPWLEIGQYTLSKVLESRIAGGIQIGVGDIVRNSLTKSFKVIERRYTHYLLAAIYYDLWQNINNDRNIYKCANRSCGLPFVKSKRKKYCSDACKQEAYRSRKRQEKGI